MAIMHFLLWLIIYLSGENGHDMKFGLQNQIWSWSVWTLKTIHILAYCLNLVVFAWMGYELSCRQAQGWHIHYTYIDRHTLEQMQAMTIPEGQNWPQVKMADIKAYCKTAVSPKHRQWRYRSLALSHQYNNLKSPSTSSVKTWIYIRIMREANQCISSPLCSVASWPFINQYDTIPSMYMIHMLWEHCMKEETSQ